MTQNRARRVAQQSFLSLMSAMVFQWIGASLLFTNLADGASLFSQTDSSSISAALLSNGDPDGLRVADNFVLPGSQPFLVKSIEVKGGYVSADPPPITPPLESLPADNFQVSFFADDGGRPGEIIVGGDYSNLEAATRNPTNGPLLGQLATPLGYEIEFLGGVLLQPNTPYWVSVSNNLRPSFGWLWSRAAATFDNQIITTTSNDGSENWNSPGMGGMHFGLRGNAVPEPHAFCLAVFCSLLMFFRMRFGNAI